MIVKMMSKWMVKKQEKISRSCLESDNVCLVEVINGDQRLDFISSRVAYIQNFLYVHLSHIIHQILERRCLILALHKRKFSEAARVKYLTNDKHKVIICHLEFKISEFEKETNWSNYFQPFWIKNIWIKNIIDIFKF